MRVRAGRGGPLRNSGSPVIDDPCYCCWFIQARIEKWSVIIKWGLKSTISLRSAKHFHGVIEWTLAASLDRDRLLHFREWKETWEGPKTSPCALCFHSALSCGPHGKRVPSECHHTPNPHKHLNKARLSFGESRAFQESFLKLNSWNSNFISLELT